MAKKVISVAEIASRISGEMGKYPQCAGTIPPQVYWHIEDEGCNWDVDILPGPGSSNAMSEECDNCIQEAVQALRANYNVFEPG